MASLRRTLQAVFLSSISAKRLSAIFTVPVDDKLAPDKNHESASALVAQGNEIKDESVGAAGLKNYHTSKKIFSMMEEMAKNCEVPMKTQWVKDSEGKGELFVVDLGHEHAEKAVLVAANEHARELLTGEVVLRFAEKVCGRKPQAKTEKTHGSSYLQQTSDGTVEMNKAAVAAMLQNVRYTLLPVVNVKGRELVETKEKLCMRLTTQDEGDVDVNRNMDVDWGKGDGQPWGSKPFSTYQARVLRDVAANRKPQSYVDLHTGARDLMTSYGYEKKVSTDYKDQKKMLDVVKERHCPDCKIGPNSVVIGYPNPGEVIDHMYLKEKIKYTSLWELYEGPNQNDCLEYFNPPDHEYESYVDSWSNALLTVGEYVDTKVSKDERSKGGFEEWQPTDHAASFVSQSSFESASKDTQGSAFMNHLTT